MIETFHSAHIKSYKLAELLSIATSNRPRRDCRAMKLVMPHKKFMFW